MSRTNLTLGQTVWIGRGSLRRIFQHILKQGTNELLLELLTLSLCCWTFLIWGVEDMWETIPPLRSAHSTFSDLKRKNRSPSLAVKVFARAESEREGVVSGIFRIMSSFVQGHEFFGQICDRVMIFSDKFATGSWFFFGMDLWLGHNFLPNLRHSKIKNLIKNLTHKSCMNKCV